MLKIELLLISATNFKKKTYEEYFGEFGHKAIIKFLTGLLVRFIILFQKIIVLQQIEMKGNCHCV